MSENHNQHYTLLVKLINLCYDYYLENAVPIIAVSAHFPDLRNVLKRALPRSPEAPVMITEQVLDDEICDAAIA